MSYTIFVRDIPSPDASRSYMLACEIGGREEAEQMVDRLAHSYREHGIERGTNVHWFCDEQGLHKIWAQRTVKPAMARRSSSRRQAMDARPRKIEQHHVLDGAAHLPLNATDMRA